MTGGRRDRRRARLRLALAVIVAVALIAPALRAFRNLPYYHYVDEGHLLLWTRTVFVGDAPDNIFYGPLLYYLYVPAAAVGDLIASLTGSADRYFTSELFAQRPRPEFYGDLHPSWMLAVARSYSMAFFALAIGCVAAVLRRTCGDVAAIAGALTLASVPYCQSFAANAQPEMAILGVGCLAIRYASRKSERGFDTRSTATLALLCACLGALKIYALLYAGLGWLVVYRATPTERRRNGLLFVAIVLGASLLLYLPYRTPRHLVRVMSWAVDYYAGKPPGSLIAMLLDGEIYTYAHLGLFAAGAAALLAGRSRTVFATVAILAGLNVAYFQTHAFANPRNVILVAGVGALLAGRAVGMLVERAAPRQEGLGASRIGVGVVMLGLVVLLLHTSYDGARSAPTTRDARLVAADLVRESAQRGTRMLVSWETEIHSATLAVGGVSRFRQKSTKPGAVPLASKGDILVVREGGTPLAPEFEALRARAEFLGRTEPPYTIGIYRVGHSAPR